jgi:hypothetical protein
VNSVGEKFKHRLSKLAANIAVALIFGAIGTLSSAILASVSEGFGFYTWLVLTLVGGVFLVRALFDVLTIGDKTVALFMARIGIQQRLSKRRMAKDSICIIATILATAAIFPFLKTLGIVGTVLQSAIIIVAIGTIFLFVYDISRTLYQIFHKKASAVSDWLGHKPDEENK